MKDIPCKKQYSYALFLGFGKALSDVSHVDRCETFGCYRRWARLSHRYLLRFSYIDVIQLSDIISLHLDAYGDTLVANDIRYSFPPAGRWTNLSTNMPLLLKNQGHPQSFAYG